MTAIRYTSVEAVPVKAWQIQGTVYETKIEAQYAAAKLLTAYNIAAVTVKRLKQGGFALMYSRNQNG